MRRAVVLQQVPLEGPGRIEKALRAAGYTLEVRLLRTASDVPSDLDGFDALVVMGGPMGVGDLEDPRYPFLSAELELLRRAVSRGFPVLGVCLGSQLLAAAAGARVYPNLVGDPPRPLREVGWGAVHFVENAKTEPVLTGLDPSELVFHWHGDTFDLPSGAVLLASTLHCKHQMFRLGTSQFGLQFHIEVDAADIEAWLEADPDYVRGALGASGPHRIGEDTRRFMRRYVERGDLLLANLIASLGS